MPNNSARPACPKQTADASNKPPEENNSRFLNLDIVLRKKNTVMLTRLLNRL